MPPPAPDTARPKADAPAGGPSPDLGDLLRTGAVLCGVRVTAVRIETADGRVQRLMLPAPAGPPAGGDGDRGDDPFAPERLTKKQRDVVQAIDEACVSDVLSYDEIADKAGWKNTKDLQDFVRDYAEQTGRLVKHRYGWEKVK